MRRTRRVLLPSAAAAVLALGAAGTSPAQAGDAPRAPGSGPAAVAAPVAAPVPAQSGADPRTAATALERYWTTARMAKALPAVAPKSGPAEPGTLRQGPTGEPGSIAPAPPARGTRADTAGVGKVFYTHPADGKDYFCSASALASPSKQLVITAAHCVNEGGTNGTAGRYVSNWVYVPAFRSGTRPHGTFQAKEFRAFSGWVNSSDLRLDIAMVTTRPLSGRKLIDVTGGNGLSWNYDRQQTVTVAGYSFDHNTGQIQRSCRSTASPLPAPDERVQIQCAFRGGGGPWLRNPVASSGLGHVNGVVSTLITGGWNRSSYFDDAVKAMWDAQGGRT
ncbi:hypothetical protein ABT354_33895 [Streptomyces sp. NPDC000594]|uniref:trypsin-like serine peptidase n=1 Tax=Streptomyces sp. NPDC000594 TaxID=3154261 RepID=UPI00331A9C90